MDWIETKFIEKKILLIDVGCWMLMFSSFNAWCRLIFGQKNNVDKNKWMTRQWDDVWVFNYSFSCHKAIIVN